MALFLLTVAVTAAALIWLVRRTPFTLSLLLWIAFTGFLAYSGFLTQIQRLPFLIAAAILASTYFARTLRDDVPIHWLIGYQAFRIPVEIFLHNGFSAGFVPVQMTWDGRNFDVLSGLTAIPIAWLAARNQLPVWAVKLWNLFGFALLLNIMTVAILSLPTPLRQFHNEPANRFVALFPYVWLPAVLVPAAWFGHIALFRRLAK
jgi:hypothetical protein